MEKVKFWVEFGDELGVEFPDKYDPLEASIQKWEFLAKHPEIVWAHGADTCGLCQKFVLKTGSCVGCPVEQAGHLWCEGTPYDAWIHHHTTKNALEEVEFLKSLRKDYNG